MYKINWDFTLKICIHSCIFSCIQNIVRPSIINGLVCIDLKSQTIRDFIWKIFKYTVICNRNQHILKCSDICGLVWNFWMDKTICVLKLMIFKYTVLFHVFVTPRNDKLCWINLEQCMSQYYRATCTPFLAYFYISKK